MLPPSTQPEFRPLAYQGGVLRYLDQSRLPAEVRYVDTRDWRDVERAIRRLEVRGAPLIGIAGAYALALAALNGEAEEAAKALIAARPTAVNLRWAVERALAAGPDAAAIEREAVRIHEEQAANDTAMATHGALFIPLGSTVLTHCNTGALATGCRGTALGVIKAAHHEGRVDLVLVDETRPLLQGARLTAWELEQEGIPYRIIVDGAAASLIARGAVHAVLVGADRIAANGDVANKIGTYGLALAARAHSLPFYVVAPLSTIDPHAPSGKAIVIEQRAPDEVLTFGKARTAPPGAEALNPAFDVTPASLVTAIVTESGVLEPPYTRSIASQTQQPAVTR